MSVWDSATGAPITGDERSSFANNFPSLPDNTQANAMIMSFTSEIYEQEMSYQIKWQILDGDFKGCNVKQRIGVYDAKDYKAQVARNMFKRMWILCDLKPTHSRDPDNNDLAVLKHKILSIKIGNGIIEGADRTWVREVWPENHLEVCTGNTVVSTSKPRQAESTSSGRPESALDRQAKRNASAPADDADLTIDNDIPF